MDFKVKAEGLEMELVITDNEFTLTNNGSLIMKTNAPINVLMEGNFNTFFFADDCFIKLEMIGD